MVSNLRSARRAIEAEMSYAKQGAAYYLSRVEALEIALHQLETVDSNTRSSAKESKPPRDTENSRSRTTVGRRSNEAKSSRGKIATAKISEADGLPTTGRDFWLNLIGNQPQSAVDIANAAVSALGISPDQKKQIQKIKQRAAPALASLIATQKIKDSGSGRERRFFKVESIQ